MSDDDGSDLSAAARGRGELPSAATARLDRLRRTGSWTSGLSVDEFAAIRDVGFDPVGQVLGATVHQIGFTGWGGCGVRPRNATGRGAYGQPTFGQPTFGTPARSPSVAGTGGTGGSPWVGYRSLVTALYAARRRALRRLEQECVAVGGDGVVAVRLTMSPYPGAAQAMEFTASGTAVRARGRHPRRPFTSDLSGQEFATLLRAGWVPCGLVLGVAVGVRHDDYRTRSVTLSWRNGEVPGYTELVQHARAEVRSEVERDLARQGGTGLVVQAMTLRIHEQECRLNQGARDHVAEATLIGTALTPFRHDAGPGSTAPLRIMRLGQRHEQVVADHLTHRHQEFR